MACWGEQTIGSSASLKEVFSNTGTPVRLPKAAKIHETRRPGSAYRLHATSPVVNDRGNPVSRRGNHWKDKLHIGRRAIDFKEGRGLLLRDGSCERAIRSRCLIRSLTTSFIPARSGLARILRCPSAGARTPSCPETSRESDPEPASPPHHPRRWSSA